MSKEIDNSQSIESLIQLAQASTEGTFREHSMEDRVLDVQSRLVDSIPTYVKDHYTNTLTATGNADKVESFTSYGFSNDTLNWTLWLALYNDSWVFRRAIDKPAQDEVKCGITLHGENDFTKVYELYNKYSSELIQLLSWGALFGGSIGVILFDGIKNEEMEKPINKKLIKGKRFKMYVTDRWYGGFADTSKMVKRMSDLDYGKPMYYNVTFPDGKMYRVHHSYILRYEHRWAPPLIKNGQLQGWGYAEGSHILNELSRDDKLKAAIMSLINKSLIEVIKMKGMRGVFMGTDKGNEKQLRKRLEMVNWGRSFNSLTFLDKDDDYDMKGFQGMSGLSDLLEKNMWLVAAALEMEGILYGDLKGGLSQNTDAYKRYSETIKSRCNSYFRPVVQKFLTIIYCVLDINENVSFDFNSLDKNEENKLKVEAIRDLSNVLSVLERDGVITKYQYAKAIQDLMNNNVINLNISDLYLNKLKLEEEQSILDSIQSLNKKGRNIETPQFSNNESPMITPSISEEMEFGGNEEEEGIELDVGESTNNETSEQISTE